MEHIYLIHEREFITTNKHIYKIGRSTNISNRMLNYPKGSNILLILHVSNCTLLEKLIKKEFNDKYILRKEYGLEYYEGNKDDMINDIFTINSNYMSLSKIQNNTLPILPPLPIIQNNTLPILSTLPTLPIIQPNITPVDINLLDDYFKRGLLYNKNNI